MKIDDSRNIVVRIANEAFRSGNLRAICKKLRDAGIPVREDGRGLRLLDEWSVVDPDKFNSETDYIIGRGVLTVFDDYRTNERVYDYRQPVPKARPTPRPRPKYAEYWEDELDDDVIDVEAREIKDVPLIEHDD